MFIKSILNRIKKALILIYQQSLGSIISNSKISALRKLTYKEELIKVGFIVQMPELWDKQESVFKLMLANKNFDPWLIIVPAYDFENSKISDYCEEKAFFSNVAEGKYILAKENNAWRDLSLDRFEYIFYQRPYDHYLPSELQSDNISKKFKICYIPYATPEIKNTGLYPFKFFKNVYLGFMEDGVAADYNNKRFHIKKHFRFLNIGYPPFQKCMSINYNSAHKTVLWTPRWSYDPEIGGSHFFEYVDQLSDYSWHNAQLIVRPHPMMWSNFLKEKRIDENGINEILAKWDKKGILVDKNSKIEDTFLNVDIMISDRSSVIPMFFLTGKPIIYCEFSSDYGSLFSTMYPGLYIANDWDDVDKHLKMLLSGEDPKKELRREIINNSFCQHKNACKSIVEYIYKDARGCKYEANRYD